MKPVSALQYKARCLDIPDRVAAGGPGVVVTKRVRPVARVESLVQPPLRIVGAMKGEIEVLGDIVKPLGGRWSAAGR